MPDADVHYNRLVPVPLLVPVPGTGPEARGGFGVCLICRGAAARGLQMCWSCRVVGRQLDRELTRVVPISLYSPRSPLHELLVGYKAAASSGARRQRQAQLSRLIGAFLDLHLGCLLGEMNQGRRPVLAVPVPSSSDPRPSWGGTHPLAELLQTAVANKQGVSSAAVAVKGDEPVGHLRAHPRGFRAAGDVAGRRTLVVDDTYTSGARSQSVAAALSDAGAEVVAIVPVGRLVHPGHNRATSAFWERQAKEPFDPRRCACPCLLVVAKQAPSGEQQATQLARSA